MNEDELDSWHVNQHNICHSQSGYHAPESKLRLQFQVYIDKTGRYAVIASVAANQLNDFFRRSVEFDRFYESNSSNGCHFHRNSLKCTVLSTFRSTPFISIAIYHWLDVRTEW